MTDLQNVSTKDRTGTAQPETTRGGVYFTPRVDIYETDNELILFAELPGVKPEDVDLRYENGELLLHGRIRPLQGRQNVLLQK